MARPKSEFVSAFGTSFEIFKVLAEEVYSSGGNDEDLRRIIKEHSLRQQIVKLLVANVYQLNVFRHSINDLVRQGNYGWSNPDINDQNFKDDEMHQCGVVLRHFNKAMSTEAVLRALDEEGLRPITMSELLELGSCYPEVQKQFPIVELGSVWQDPHGRRGVGYLCYLDDQRRLLLHWLDYGWRDDCRFAAVCK